jgi:signal transduction histidine kinase
VIAAHRWSVDELTDLVAHPSTTSPADGGVLVVPLVTRDRRHGFLLADHDGAAFRLDEGQGAAVSILAAITSAFLERAVAYDDLLRVEGSQANFIAVASHELRTSTAAVSGIATTLHRRGDVLTAEQRRALSKVLCEQGERLHRLVDQLLDLSRLEATSVVIAPTALSVRERTEEIVRDVAAERADEIDIRIDSTLLAYADAAAFDHIVSNLITNALRYGHAPIGVSASARDRHFRFAVEDSGPGVSRELESKLFDRFTRGEGATGSGAGLGLSIARAYAHAHGGELVYSDVAPHGARFELVFPISSSNDRSNALWRLLPMYETAISELRATGDPALEGLIARLTRRQAEVIGGRAERAPARA